MYHTHLFPLNILFFFHSTDMEEDPELRKHVNVYKDSKKMAVDTESEIGEGKAFFLVFFT